MKIGVILYFVILFGILGSYLAGSLYDQDIWLQIISADSLSSSQHNAIQVWVRDPDSHRTFEGFSLQTQWARKMPGCPQSNPECAEGMHWKLLGHPESQAVAPDGRTVVRLPLWEQVLDEVVAVGLAEVMAGEAPQAAKNSSLAVHVALWQDGDNPRIVREVDLPLDAFLADEGHDQGHDENVHYAAPVAPDGSWELFSVFAPLALMYGVPTDVFVLTLGSDGPYRGDVQLDQLSRIPAVFPHTVHTDGIARVALSLQGPVDLRLTAGDREYYANLVPGMRPLAAYTAKPLVTPSAPTSPVVINPFGTMPTITIDYFDGKAWIGRQKILPEDVTTASLSFDYRYGDPAIVYARVNNTDVGSEDSAQTLALIASQQDMTLAAQAEFAVQKLAEAYPEDPDPKLLAKMIAQNPGQVDLIRNIRDYALLAVAANHHATIRQHISTDALDRAAFLSQKDSRKSISNILLLAWFGVGVLGALILCIRARKRERELATEYSAEALAARGGFGKSVFVLVILFIGFMVSLYFMMQIV